MPRTRSGESPIGAVLEFIVDEELAGQRIDQALSLHAGVPRAQAKQWIEAGRVALAGDVVRRAGRKVAGGETLVAEPPEPLVASAKPEAIPLVVLHEDSDLIVIDKPAGLVVHPAPGHPSGTLVNALMHHCRDLAGVGGVLRPGIVHRLDRGTSGVMVAAKNDATHAGLAAQFHDHTIERIYLAFVRGLPGADSGFVDRPIGRHPRDRKRMSTHTRSGRPATTRWRVTERYPASQLTQLEIRPETGRTHQIRVHLASVGLPVFADPVYGRAAKRTLRGVTPLDRPALHAAVLGFVHPRSVLPLRFESPLPDDLSRLRSELRAREGRA